MIPFPRPPRFSRKLPYDEYLFQAFNRRRSGAFRRQYGHRRLHYRPARYEARQHGSFASTMKSLERFMRGGRV